MLYVDLLVRFDLIYLILDKPNADSDRRLARHLVSLYYPEGDKIGQEGEKWVLWVGTVPS